MSYRDDRDADQARIAALEAELATAQKRVDELEGKRSHALTLAGGGALAVGKPTTGTKIAGAPLRLELARTFDAALSADLFEDLVGVIRQVTGDRGRTELMRSSMTWWASSPDRGAGPFTCVTVTIKDGVTTLSVTDRLGPLAGALYGGIGGGVGGGAIMAPIGATIAMPILAPVFFAAWFGGVYAACRALFKRGARKRAERLQITFDAVTAEIERRLRAPASTERTPVEIASGAEPPGQVGSASERKPITE